MFFKYQILQSQYIIPKLVMKIYFYFFAFAFSCCSFGQNLTNNYEIGCFMDYDKQLINGYSDFDYEPEKSLKVSYVMQENFTDGYFIDKDGVKVNRLLKYSLTDRNLKFKSKIEDEDKSLEPDDCNGYVIGIDTICVLKNIELQGVFGDTPSERGEFAEFMEKVDGMSFYKFNAMGANAPYIQYIVKKSDAIDYLNFPSGSGKFKKMATDIFGSDTVLKADIEKGKYKEKDIPSMIKIYKYRKLFANNKKIYFNSSWNETDNAKESSYYAKIEIVHDSIFHLGYFFNNDVKIY